MRRIALITIAVMLVATGAFSASMATGTIKMLGGGTDSVAHCRVLDYDIASDTIGSVNANVECDLTASYTVEATVNSGASSTTGQTATSLTANTPLVVAVTISPSVTISGSTYDIDIRVKN